MRTQGGKRFVVLLAGAVAAFGIAMFSGIPTLYSSLLYLTSIGLSSIGLGLSYLGVRGLVETEI